MAETFSWMEALSASYFLNMTLNTLVAKIMIRPSTTARKKIAIRNMELRRGLMMKLITIELTSISGARTAMRRHIWYAFCTLVTSVVMRVMRPAVLNLSMFEKENRWILS